MQKTKFTLKFLKRNKKETIESLRYNEKPNNSFATKEDMTVNYHAALIKKNGLIHLPFFFAMFPFIRLCRNYEHSIQKQCHMNGQAS